MTAAEPRLPIIATGIHPLNGRPWGHGATAVRLAHRREPCDECDTLAKRGEGRHLMPDRATICTPCARTRCEAHGYQYPQPTEDQ